jgi:flagellar biogenesis protein FliO
MPKWLFLPPAVALLMVLGPLSMQGGTTGGVPDPTTPTTGGAAAPAPAPTVGEGRPAPAAPRMPDAWQLGSTLLAVLMLGAAGVLVLRKLRGGAVPARGAASLVTLRQTLRLSARQAVHALEFDDRILLVGEHERGLVLLESGRSLARADEHEVVGREQPPADVGDEDGAVPKNLVIPRPPRPGTRPIPAPTAAPLPVRNPGLNDFRALLQKVGRA